MKQISKRLTYANVMSSIAVFLVLGGASALAASHLGKNSVGSKQLKKNAVTAAKIKTNAVTSAKIGANAVDGSKVKDGSLSGADINLGSLGTVPSANNANNATNAANAGNATKVNGVSIIRFGQRSDGGTGERDVFNNGHLRVTYECASGGEITVRAYTATDHASIQSYGTSSDTNNSDFNTGSPEVISASDEQRDIVYTDESGDVIHLSYLAEEGRSSGPECILAGFAEDQ
jgi:hypothetical protein